MRVIIMMFITFFMAANAHALLLCEDSTHSFSGNALSGDYLALTYKTQGFDQTIVQVVDLSSRKVIYEKKIQSPGDIAVRPGLWQHYLLYQTRQSIVRVDLTSGNEESVEGIMFGLTSDGHLVTDTSIIDIAKLEETFKWDRKILVPQIIIGNAIVFSRDDERTHNLAGFEAFSTFGASLFRVYEDDPHNVKLPGDRSSTIRGFPLPVFRYAEGRWFLDLLDENGGTIVSHSLEQMKVPVKREGGGEKNWLHNFKVLEGAGGVSLVTFSVLAEGNDRTPSFFYFLIDSNGHILRTFSDLHDVCARFGPDDELIMISSETGSQRDFTLSQCDSLGNIHSRTQLPSFVKDCKNLWIIDGDEILVEPAQNLLAKFSLKTGALTGIYTYPLVYVAEIAAIHDGNAWVFTNPRFRSSNPPVKGANLEPFQLSSSGWFDIELTSLASRTQAILERYIPALASARNSGQTSPSRR